MIAVLPCWRIVVRHERRSGVRGFFKSTPLTYSRALPELLGYLRGGHVAYLEEDEQLTALHRRVLGGTITMDRAKEIGRQKGWL